MSTVLSPIQFHRLNLTANNWFLFMNNDNQAKIYQWCERNCGEEWFTILTEEKKCIFYIREGADAVAFRICNKLVAYLGYELVQTSDTRMEQ